MRRTKTHEQREIGRARVRCGLSSIQEILTRWTLIEASVLKNESRLLPGGQAQANVLDTLRQSREGDARCVRAGGPEPGVGYGEEGGPAGISRTMRLLHLHMGCGAGMAGEENGEIAGDTGLRNHAT